MRSEEQVLADIVEWSEDCPAWQRDALRRLYEHNELSNTDLQQLVELCKNGGVGAQHLSISTVKDSISTSKTVNLRSVNRVSNINALASDQYLNFSESGLTVIYGANGSGKSGYARILKSCCRARLPREGHSVLPNVYAKEEQAQRATIEFSVDGQGKRYDWTTNAPADTDLLCVSVFDNRTAKVHVEDTNEVAYTPYPMLVLERLAKAATYVKEHINNEIEDLKQQTPKSISTPKCHQGTQVFTLLTDLSERTDRNQVNELAHLSEKEVARYDQLKQDLSSNSADSSEKLEVLRKKLRAFNDKFEQMQHAVSEQQLEKLISAYKTYTNLKAAAHFASESLFANEPLPGVGSEVWAKLWESARMYSERYAYPDELYPWTKDGALCVLCQQKLEGETTKRVVRFENFVMGETKLKEKKALDSYKSVLTSFRRVKVSVNEVRDVVNKVRHELRDNQLADRIQRVAILLKWRLRSILRSHVSESIETVFSIAEPWPIEDIDNHTDALSERIKELKTQHESDVLNKLQSEFKNLEDRIWLSEVQEELVDEIGRLRVRSMLKQRLKDTATHRISTKSKALAEELVTRKLSERFKQEIEELGGKDLKIDLRKKKASYGVSYFKIVLNRSPSSTVGEILSEGEEHCVALAAFLADLGTTESRGAIVLDDPVSSLDHIHRRPVSKRLVDESIRRQVIVFTHDLPFLYMLNQAAHKHQSQISIRHVARSVAHTGNIQEDPPVHVQSVEKAINGMQKKLDNEKIHYEKGDQPNWENTVDVLSKRLRRTWERAVEEALSPVFKRMSEKVQTDGLTKVAAITQDDCKAMRRSYELSSSLLHSSPDAFGETVTKPDEIQQEIDNLRDWFDSIRIRQGR